MAKVFQGKGVIPGDKIHEYFKLLKEAEQQRRPFRDMLTSLKEEFECYLENKFSLRTARKHTCIVEMFIEFLCKYTDVMRIEEITRGMVNTNFNQWWKRKVWDSSTPADRRLALKKFFCFLESEIGIVNAAVLKALK